MSTVGCWPAKSAGNVFGLCRRKEFSLLASAMSVARQLSPEAGPEFRNVNIMAVAHGTDKMRLLKHKAAIDAHLAAKNIPVSYTNVFWGGRSEIKPSEISPMLYREWLGEMTPRAA